MAQMIEFFVALVLIAILGIGVVIPVVNNTLDGDVEGESFSISASPSDWQLLDQEDIESGSETVYNTSGTEVESGDYNINYSDSSINATSDWNTTTDGTSGTIDYKWHKVTGIARTMLGFVSTVIAAFMVVFVGRQLREME